MKLSQTIKTIFAWVGLFLIIPGIIGLVESDGLIKIIFVFTIIILCAIIWRWKALYNYVKNTESNHSFSVLNEKGDVLHEHSVSILPLLWPLKTKKIFTSLSGEDSKIEYVKVNCDVEWVKQEEKIWEGLATLNRHRAKLFSFGKGAGTRLEKKALLVNAMSKPPFDFVVTCGPKKSTRIALHVKWCKERAPSNVLFQFAPFPSEVVIKKEMVDTSKIPWMTIEDQCPNEDKNGEYHFRFNIDKPKKYHLYRIYWKIEDEPK